jgi:hypothetical protein
MKSRAGARRERAARYFNKEYCTAPLTYLVTPSDYDKLTAAYFLPRGYPGGEILTAPVSFIHDLPYGF